MATTTEKGGGRLAALTAVKESVVISLPFATGQNH